MRCQTSLSSGKRVREVYREWTPSSCLHLALRWPAYRLGCDRDLRAVVNIQLAHQCRHMCFHGCLSDAEVVRDLLVEQAGMNALHNPSLGWRELHDRA